MILNPQLGGLPAIHPGIILEDVVVPGAGLDASQFADAIKVELDIVKELFAGKRPVTADLADRIGRWVEGDSDLWLRLQANHDERVAAGYPIAAAGDYGEDA